MIWEDVIRKEMEKLRPKQTDARDQARKVNWDTLSSSVHRASYDINLCPASKKDYDDDEDDGEEGDDEIILAI